MNFFNRKSLFAIGLIFVVLHGVFANQALQNLRAKFEFRRDRLRDNLNKIKYASQQGLSKIAGGISGLVPQPKNEPYHQHERKTPQGPPKPRQSLNPLNNLKNLRDKLLDGTQRFTAHISRLNEAGKRGTSKLAELLPETPRPKRQNKLPPPPPQPDYDDYPNDIIPYAPQQGGITIESKISRQIGVLGDGLLAVAVVAVTWGVGGGLVTYVTSIQRSEIRRNTNAACSWVSNVANVPTPPALDTTYTTPTISDAPTALDAVKTVINSIRDQAAFLLPQCQYVERIQFPGL